MLRDTCSTIADLFTYSHVVEHISVNKVTSLTDPSNTIQRYRSHPSCPDIPLTKPLSLFFFLGHPSGLCVDRFNPSVHSFHALPTMWSENTRTHTHTLNICACMTRHWPSSGGKNILWCLKRQSSLKWELSTASNILIICVYLQGGTSADINECDEWVGV